MKESEIIISIKKDMYSKVVENKNIYMLNQTPTNKEIYLRLLTLYKEINKAKSISEIEECLKHILTNLAELKEVHTQKIKEYEKDKTNESIKDDLKNLCNISQVLNEAYSSAKILISKYVKRKKTNLDKKFKKKELPQEQLDTENELNKQTNKEEPKVEQAPIESKTEVKKYVDGVNLNLPLIQELEQINNEVLQLQEKIAQMDQESKETIPLRKKRNELWERRKQIAYEIDGEDGMQFTQEIESIEIRYSHASNQKTKKEKEYDLATYNKEIMQKTLQIGELMFYQTKSNSLEYLKNHTQQEKEKEVQNKLAKYGKEYQNLINSLFGISNPIIYKNEFTTIRAFDIIKKIGLYGPSGNYDEFKEKYPNFKLGNKEFTKELYDKQIEEIQLLIKSFNVLSSEQMNLKGGKIVVSYEVEPKKELKSEIDKKMIELYRKICDQNKGFSM